MTEALVLTPKICKLASTRDILSLRHEFSRMKHAMFDHCAGPLLNCMGREERHWATRIFDLYHFHHVIPLKLGGTNDPSNIVLANPKLHSSIHAAINRQEKLRFGEERELLIPTHPRRYRIWGYAPTLIITKG